MSSPGLHTVGHPPPCQVTFTGSTSVGRGVGQKAGDALKTNTLELGGKSPVIICPDVDIDDAVEVSTTRQLAVQAIDTTKLSAGFIESHTRVLHHDGA